MELVANGPVATPNRLDLVKGDHGSFEAGDSIAHLVGGLTRFDVSVLKGAAQDLGDTWSL